jgi:CheY-like chemotaxis protein
MMPVTDGWDATRALRANHKTKEIPSLASTALFRSSHLNACLEAGCNDYILKPFSFLELQRKIRALLVGTALRPIQLFTLGSTLR